MSLGSTLTGVIGGPNFVAGTVGNVVLVNWRAQPTRAAVLEVDALMRRLLEEHPGQIGFVAIVEATAPAPDVEARDTFADAMRAQSKRIRGSVLVLEGTGLASAAKRAVVTAITLLGDIDPTPQVCSNVDEAGANLARVLDDKSANPLHAGDISAAARQLRSMPLPAPAGR